MVVLHEESVVSMKNRATPASGAVPGKVHGQAEVVTGKGRDDLRRPVLRTAHEPVKEQNRGPVFPSVHGVTELNV